MKVLVTHASKHGSTAEIAERIANVLMQHPLQVEILPVNKVNQVSDYDVIVLGSAVYSARWMQDAVEFLKIRGDALTGKPLWLFSSGPIAEGDPSETMDGFVLPVAVKELVEHMHVRGAVIFHGKIDIRNLSLAELMLFKSVGAQTGDFRRWDLVEAWAHTIANAITPAHS